MGLPESSPADSIGTRDDTQIKTSRDHLDPDAAAYDGDRAKHEAHSGEPVRWLPGLTHEEVYGFCTKPLRPSGYGISGRCSADAPSVPPPDGSAPFTDAASGVTPDRLRARRKP